MKGIKAALIGFSFMHQFTDELSLGRGYSVAWGSLDCTSWHNLTRKAKGGTEIERVGVRERPG